MVLADPAVPLEEAWMHQRFRGETEYEGTNIGGVAAIRAVWRNSASSLYHRVIYRLAEHPWLEEHRVTSYFAKLLKFMTVLLVGGMIFHTDVELALTPGPAGMRPGFAY